MSLDYSKLQRGYKIFACNGILFNRCPRRGETFVTRKIVLFCKIKLGYKNILGNLDKKRLDMPKIMLRQCEMLQTKTPSDYVIYKQYSQRIC